MNYIFDLFGTLVTDNKALYYEILAEDLGLTKEEYQDKIRVKLCTTNYISKKESLDDILETLGLDWDEAKKVSYLKKIEEWKDSLEMYEGAIEVLQELRRRGSKIAILSNNNILVESVLERKVLRPYTDVVILSHKVGALKPDKEIYRTALDALGCEASDVTMVGDQLAKDVLGPIEIGMQGVLFDPENKSDYSGKKISKLRELL